ncbi:hypothetical protein VTH82DRAFT_4533 [Thermothelomyces myriococcoides]
MPNQFLNAFSSIAVVLNRGLAYLDRAVHYASGYILYYLFNGLKPQTHTRPCKTRHGRYYSPAVVVTGASEGIGFATALHLANKGYTVFATAPSDTELSKIRQAAAEYSNGDGSTRGGGGEGRGRGALHPAIMDVLSPDSITHCAGHIESVLGGDPDRPLVGVVNNAGYCMISPMELTPEADARRVFELDFWAYISVIRAFLPVIKRNKGRFVNIGSYGGYVNPPLWAPYCALKAAVEGMTRAWRLELLPFGVGMTTVRPGWTRTGGVGPGMETAWAQYWDNLSKGAVGVDSFGRVIRSDGPVQEAEERVYRPMIDKWHKLTSAAMEGAAQPAEAVASTVHDALTDRFLQPYYTVGYDALLGQMARDLTPENIYEYFVAKTFGAL